MLRPRPALLVSALVLPLAGCSSIGPGTVTRDRFDYGSAITESWKRQTLLNIVKLRYLDPPIFVDVGQIVAGYSLEIGLSAGGSLPESDTAGGTTTILGASGKFIDRPTVTYTPLTGNKFVKGLMTPIAPDVLFFTIQSGWPADAMLLAAAASLNGLKNAETTAGVMAPPDADFISAIRLMRKIQASGAVGLRVVQGADKLSSTLITFRAKDISQETLGDIKELRRLLRLNPEAQELKLVFGAMPENDREVAVVTRSMMHIMLAMAAQVEVPPEHAEEGRTNPGWKAADDDPERGRMIQIHSSTAAPPDPYVAVEYRGHWFWVDDRDLRSKRAMAFTMMLFTLADTGDKENLPLITIPAQ